MSDEPIRVHEVTDEELAEASPEYARILAERKRIVDTIERIRRDDSDFITPETIRTYTGCTEEQARAGIVTVFGQDWLDRQDAAR